MIESKPRDGCNSLLRLIIHHFAKVFLNEISKENIENSNGKIFKRLKQYFEDTRLFIYRNRDEVALFINFLYILKTETNSKLYDLIFKKYLKYASDYYRKWDSENIQNLSPLDYYKRVNDFAGIHQVFEKDEIEKDRDNLFDHTVNKSGESLLKVLH